MTQEFRGVYAIPVTPFTERDTVDHAVLEAVIEYTIAAGAHGLVNPVNVSEFFTLTDEERREVIRTTVRACGGRVPVVAGVSAPSTSQAVAFARHAREAGADSVIALPPYVRAAGRDQLVDYFRAIGAAAELPVWIQNRTGGVGGSLSAELLAEIVTTCEHVAWLKEETDASSHLITRVRELCDDQLKGVMGGKGGRFLIDEHRRGACGTMPGCEVTEVHVALWNALETGNWKTAQEVYQVLLPTQEMEHQYGGAVFSKEVLYRRGVLTNTAARQPGIQRLDDYDHQRLDELLDNAHAHLICTPQKSRTNVPGPLG